jgi:anti-anti-sigma factor
MQDAGLEWIYRILQDPMRLWKRYFVGFFKFGLMLMPALLYFRYRRLLNRFFQGRRPVKTQQHTADRMPLERSLKVITLPPRLDAAYLSRSENEIAEALEQADGAILDLSRTSFVDSSGLGFLIGLWRQSDKGKKTLYMTGVTPSIGHFFKLNRVWDLFEERLVEDVNAVPTSAKEQAALPVFRMVLEVEEGFVLLSLFGSLDAGEMAGLDLDATIRDMGDRDCIFCLGKLDFVDSSGIIFFLKIQRHLLSLGKACLLCELTDNVRQMFRMTKLIALFQIVPDVTSAKKQLGKRP